MFNISWIILKKNKINEKQVIFDIFSEEFGKIKVWIEEMKKYPIDVWSIVNINIETKNSVNKWKSYKIKKNIWYSELDFWWLERILELLKLINKISPEWIEKKIIYTDYFDILEYFCIKEKNEITIEIFKLKLISKYWFLLNIENENISENLKKIIKVINIYDIKKILKIIWIEKIINELKQFNEKNIDLYLNSN